ncbi:MAG TPA: mechanosensitive ion channel family protein [Planctomycetota bacterium]|nr:mechanosensitive ion channel family protein [Planctomycetota bacterium]
MSLLAQVDPSEWLTPERLAAALRIAVLLVVGFPLLFVLAAITGRSLKKRLTPQVAMLVRKGILYLGGTLLMVTVLYQMGFRLTALLGAAGIAGLAIGIASQTSVSNIICGLFLIGEKPFAVGDVIKVNDTVGIVLSIDLLSLKLRTFDNQFVRIPNETLVKTPVTNITRFPIRRFDIKLGVAYKEDIARVSEVLREVATANPYCLDEPEPLIMFTAFGDSALELLFAVWFAKADFLKLRTSIMREIKERFDAEGIEIPFPHRTIYTGSVTDPFPVRVVKDEGKGRPAE